MSPESARRAVGRNQDVDFDWSIRAMMADDSSTRRKSFLNDCQLKELICTEKAAKELWLKKWASLDHEREQEIYREEAVKLGLDLDFLKNFRRKHIKNDDKEIKVKIEPSPQVPRTMSQFVGWRSRLEQSLEICGPLYNSPKQQLAKEQVKSYNTIFLG